MARTVGPDGAEELIAAGDSLDREIIAGGLVHHVVASASLHRSLDVGELAAAQRARVLYLLGVAEHRIERALGPPGEVPWFPQTELLLELAIRADPQTDTASRAYRLLEQLVTAAYPGGMPEEIAQHLAGLDARARRQGEERRLR
jgi:enoyl-CoA hydratase/carnithine racemase